MRGYLVLVRTCNFYQFLRIPIIINMDTSTVFPQKYQLTNIATDYIDNPSIPTLWIKVIEWNFPPPLSTGQRTVARRPYKRT